MGKWVSLRDLLLSLLWIGYNVSGGEWIAEGSFSDSIHHASNFGQLRIHTLPSGVDDQTQMRAAGFLEGVLTAGKCDGVITCWCGSADCREIWQVC